MVAAVRTVQTPLVASSAHVERDIVLTVLVSCVMVSLPLHSYIHACTPVTYCCPVDIDECQEERDNCAQICLNNNGSYTCNCNLGYQLEPDQRSCMGEYLCTFEQLVLYDTVLVFCRH